MVEMTGNDRDSSEMPQEISPGDDTQVSTAEIQNVDEVESVRRSPSRAAVPPKRPLSTAKRPTTSASSSNPVPTARATTSRSTPMSTLSKPPSRPTPSAAAKRSAGGITSATPGHKARPSISSIDDVKKAAAGSDTENKRPLGNTAAKRLSIGPSTVSSKPNFTKATSTTEKRPGLGAVLGQDRKPISSSTNSLSPSKTALKATTTNTRATPLTTISKASRPPPTSSRALPGGAGTDFIKKRLSTIPASPAVASTAEKATKSVLLTETPTKPIRPPLGQRKSTRSATIEQRLLEMDIVNQMLTIAMAEDIDQDEEEKYEYETKANYALAHMKEKFLAARKEEGLPPMELKAPETVPASTKSSDLRNDLGEEVVVPSENSAELKAQLVQAEEQIALLKVEIKSVQTKLQSFSAEAAEAIKSVQQSTEKIREEHVSKIDTLTIDHTAELATLQARLERAENNAKQMREQATKDLEAARELAKEADSQELASKLDEQQRSHEAALKELRDKFSAEQQTGNDSSTKIAELSATIESLSSQSDLEKSKLREELAAVKTKHQADIKERDGLLDVKDEDFLNLKQKFDELAKTHTQVLAEKDDTMTRRIPKLRKNNESTRAHLSEAETELATKSAEHQEALMTKQAELDSMSQIVETLQDQMQEASFAKAREIDALKTKLAQEHETALKGTAEGQATSLEDHEFKLKKKLSEREEEIKKLNLRVHEKDLSHQKALDALVKSRDDGLQLIDQLEKERDGESALKGLLHTAHDEAATEIANLKKVLDSFDQSSVAKDDEHRLAVKRVKDELESTTEMLEDRTTEFERIANSHTETIDQIRNQHARDLESAKSEKDKAYQISLRELQAQIDALSTEIQSKEGEHVFALQAKQAEHQNKLDELTYIHASELVNLKATLQHNHEAALRAQAESHRDALTDCAKSQRQALDNLRSEWEAWHEEELAAAIKGAVADHQAAVDEDNGTHRDLIDMLQNKLEEQLHTLERTKADYEGKLAGMVESHENILNNLRSAQEEQQALAVEEALAAPQVSFDTDNKDHADIIEELQNKIETLLQEHERARRDHKTTLESRQQTEAENINALRSQLADLEKTHKAGLEARIAKYLSNTTELEEKHAAALEEARKSSSERNSRALEEHLAEADAAAAVVNEKHSAAILELNQQHEAVLASATQQHLDAEKNIEDRHRKEQVLAQEEHQKHLALTNAEHASKLSALQEQVLQSRAALADAENELQTTREVAANSLAAVPGSETSPEVIELLSQLEHAKAEAAQLMRQKMQLEGLRRQYSADGKDLRQALALDEENLTELTEAAEEATKLINSEVERLHEEISALKTEHAAELAKLHDNISLERERRDKERKQGAEVRDRLAKELDEMSVEMHAMVAEIDALKKEMQSLYNSTQDAGARLEQALTASQESEARHKGDLADFEKLKAEIETVNRKATSYTKSHARGMSTHKQELDALQNMADRERNLSDRLKKEVESAKIEKENLITRMREIEAALKVTTAELLEMKTKRQNGENYVPSSPLSTKGGLRTSRWPSVDHGALAEKAVTGRADDLNMDDAELVRAEDARDLGADIEGTMAGLQEQLRQTKMENDESMQRQQRLVDALDAASNTDESILPDID